MASLRRAAEAAAVSRGWALAEVLAARWQEAAGADRGRLSEVLVRATGRRAPREGWAAFVSSDLGRMYELTAVGSWAADSGEIVAALRHPNRGVRVQASRAEL